MAKSFKKVIACLLAVLMVCCTMPFTALAAPGDYTPDIQLQFGTIFDADDEDSVWVASAEEGETLYTSGHVFDLTYGCSIYGPMATPTAKLDAANGTYSVSKLTLKKDVINKADEFIESGVGPVEEDVEMKAGNLFTVTVRMDNFTDLYANSVAIQYSDNIIPAAITTQGSGKKAKNYIVTGTDDCLLPVEGARAIDLYEGLPPSTQSSIITDSNGVSYMRCGSASSIGGTDVTTISAADTEAILNADGSTDNEYENKFIMETFVFMLKEDISESNPIVFQMYDTDNSKVAGFGGGYLCTNDAETDPSAYTTYAVNKYGTGVENAGSTKMTFFGTNVNNEAPAQSYTVTVEAADANGTVTGGGTYNAGETATITATPNEGYLFDYWTDAAGVKQESMGATASFTVNADVSYTAWFKQAVVPHTHNYVFSKTVLPTCVAGGYDLSVCTNEDGKCDQLELKENFTEPTGVHTFTNYVEIKPQVDPTPEAPGKTAVEEATCDVCHVAKDTRGGDPIPFECDHSKTHVENKVDATCTKAGYSGDVVCDTCKITVTYGHEVKALGHLPVSAENAVEPTVSKDGKEADTICERCEELLTPGKVLPALGVKLIINETYADYGTIDVEAEKTATGNAVYASAVTITSTPVEGATFVGYEVSGKLVSTEPVYTYTAYTDLEITPVFTKDADDKITVVFYDMYSNVVESFIGVTPAYFQSMMEIMLPNAPVYAGYNFTGWSMTDDEIKALDKSATIWANYEKAENEGFTVYSDQDVTIDCGDYDNGALPFDARVTVSKAGATAWKVDDTIVGYGESYTFFVGADITVVPVTETVVAAPAVAAIDCYLITPNSHKVMFLATKTIPDGVVLVDHGFIYGKNLDDEELVLENVGNMGKAYNAGEVKKSSLGTSDIEQFGISYGISAKQGFACARAYVSFVNADGDVETVYADMLEYAYN